MSGSCCGSPKAEKTKVEMTAASQATAPASEQRAANAQKSECCGDQPAKNEKRSCGCEC
jgi:hypothetical protein